MPFPSVKILVIEDNLGDFILLESLLHETGIDTEHIMHVLTLQEATNYLSQNSVNLILLDLSLPDSTGLNSYKQIFGYENDAAVIILSGTSNEELALQIVQMGAQDYIIKDELNARILEKTILYAIERKKNLAALTHSRLEYQFLFEHNPIPMWVYDTKTLAFINVNNAAVALYGYSREEFLSMTILEIRPDYEKERVLTYTEQPQDAPYRSSGKWTHLKKNGENMTVEIASHFLNDRESKLKLVVAYDVTQEQKAKAELARSERVFRAMAESFPNGTIALLDENFHVTYTHGTEYKRKMINPAGLRGDFLLRRMVDEGQLPNFLPLLQKVLKGETLTFEWNDTTSTYEVIVSPIVGNHQFDEKILLLSQNVTEKHEIQEHLKLLESVVVNSSNGVMIVKNAENGENNRQMVFVNQAQVEMSGYSEKELLGQDPKIFQGHQKNPKALIELKKAVAQLRPYECDLRNYKKDGTPYWVNLSMVPVLNNKRVCTHYIGLSRDITERKTQEQLILKANKALQEKNEKLYEIAQINSHVIRRPVASILGLIGLLDVQKFNDNEEKVIISHLKNCAAELDEAIHQISAKIIV
jgi:PAS domain S-box-containing protein